MLWLHECREAQAGRLVGQGLKLFLPPKSSAIVRERLAHLAHSSASWELCEFNERENSLLQIEVADRGNVATRFRISAAVCCGSGAARLSGYGHAAALHFAGDRTGAGGD
jgi:hypothetical protein